MAAGIITVIAVVAGTAPNRSGKVPTHFLPESPSRILDPESHAGFPSEVPFQKFFGVGFPS